MTKIKLTEWAERNNLSYITANRHFHAGLIPNAIQMQSGTILVEDDGSEFNMNNSANDAISLFLKKTVEFSKNNSTVEDFAAYVISNFQLKLKASDTPKYSKHKPKDDEVQKHFQQFLPNQKSVEELKNVKSLLKEGKTAGEIVGASDLDMSIDDLIDKTVYQDAMNELTPTPLGIAVDVLTPNLMVSSLDLNQTWQQSQPTSSSVLLNNSNFITTGGDISGPFTPTIFSTTPFTPNTALGGFQPTSKEILSATQVAEVAEEVPRKRGRKPTFKKGQP